MLPSYRNQSIDLLANQLTGFCMRPAPALNRLNKWPVTSYTQSNFWRIIPYIHDVTFKPAEAYFPDERDEKFRGNWQERGKLLQQWKSVYCSLCLGFGKEGGPGFLCCVMDKKASLHTHSWIWNSYISFTKRWGFYFMICQLTWWCIIYLMIENSIYKRASDVNFRRMQLKALLKQ